MKENQEEIIKRIEVLENNKNYFDAAVLARNNELTDRAIENYGKARKSLLESPALPKKHKKSYFLDNLREIWEPFREMWKEGSRVIGGCAYKTLMGIYCAPTFVRKIENKEIELEGIEPAKARSELWPLFMAANIPNTIEFMIMLGIMGRDKSPLENALFAFSPFLLWGTTNTASGLYELYRHEKNRIQKNMDGLNKKICEMEMSLYSSEDLPFKITHLSPQEYHEKVALDKYFKLEKITQ